MREISRILACIDFSDYSKETIEYAIALAPQDATITIINVINNRDVNAVRSVSAYFPDSSFIDDYIEKNKVNRQQNMRNLIEENFKTSVEKCKYIIKVGVPFEEILHTIETEKIDLVVMGSKGRSNISRTLFGSNAEKVFRHSPVPVLSVRNRRSGSPRLENQE